MNSKKLRVLLVDDDPFLTELLKRHFEEEGVKEIIIARNSQECLEALKKCDVIILDYYLDDGNGIDVLREIKTQAPNLPVIFLSGQEYVNIAIRSLKFGAFDYLEKSKLNFNKLMEVITKAIEQGKLFSREERLRKIRSFPSLGLF
ncbi:MAG: response regulator [Bacteroidetes bacterium]|nr:response regulator [Bacteroidota bacterium]